MSNEPAVSQLSDLEISFQIPKEVSTEVEIKDGDKRMVYVATAQNLWFDGLDIRGSLLLRKYEVRKVTKIKKTGRWFYPKVEKVEEDERVKIWQIQDNKMFSSHFFVSDGGPARSRTCTAHCETALLGEAANSGILLSEKLVYLVLTPLYGELMRIYYRVRNFSYSRANT